MFTVIVLSEVSRKRLERWREIFTPFEESGNLALVSWSRGPAARTMRQVVPGLQSAIKGKQDWRVIVVGNGEEQIGRDYRSAHENPFDLVHNFPDRSESLDERLVPGESPFALVRLAHLLLGFPSLGVQGFEADPSFVDPETKTRVYWSDFRSKYLGSEDPATLRARFDGLMAVGNDAGIHYRVVHATEEERSRHEQVAELYSVRHARPHDMIMVAARQPVPEDPISLLRLSWDDGATQSSRFVERNGFPPSCRFVVYDKFAEDHTSHDLDQLRFWLAILSLAINDVPASAFQPERVYRAAVTLDNGALAATLNQHLGRLASTLDFLASRSRLHEAANFLEPEPALDRQSTISVPDWLPGASLHVDAPRLGLIADSPGSDQFRWSESVSAFQVRVTRFERQPRRVVARIVEDARRQRLDMPKAGRPLTSLERIELGESLLEDTADLISAANARLLDPEALEALRRRHVSTIQRGLAERMRSGATGLAFAVVLLAWLGALLPYLIGAGFRGGAPLLGSMLVALILTITMGLVGVAVLWWVRRKLLRQVAQFNSALRALMDDSARRAEELGRFLSRLVTYLWRRQLSLEEGRRAARELAEAQTLAEIQQQIMRRMDLEKGLVKSLDHALKIEKGKRSHHELAEMRPAALRREFCWPIGTGSCVLNDSGDRLRVPYDFVQRLSLTNLYVREASQAAGTES